MRVTELKKYPMAAAIYINVFHVSEEDLEHASLEEVIKDYEYLEENVEEALDTLPELEQIVLRRVLGDKQALRIVGEEIGKSRARVDQIIEKAFRHLSHPCRTRILDGSRRKWQIEAEAKQKRAEAVEERWSKVGAEIARQKTEQQAKISEQLNRGVELLSLTPVLQQKLYALGCPTLGSLLEKFPYDPQTNGLKGLAIVEGIDEVDYHEVWSALFTAGLLIRMPELPDFEKLRKAELSAAILNDVSKVDLSIEELELSVRSYNCAKRHGIQSVGEFLDRLDLSPGDFLSLSQDEAAKAIFNINIRNLGRKAAEEIAKRLREVLNGEF